MTRMLRPFLAFFLVLSMVAVGSEPAAAQEDDSVVVTLDGHGFGHGRGMSQYGAQGYALDLGWTTAEILDHYYSNTTAAAIPVPLSSGVDPDNLRVLIQSSASGSSNDGSQVGTPLRFELASGTVTMLDAAGVVDVPDIPEGMAGRIWSSGNGLVLEMKPGCSGAWDAEQEGFVSFPLPDVSAVDAKPVSSASGADSLLRVCHNNGTSSYYEGFLRGANVSGSTRTINIVSIEEYLRGVVPREVPSSWEPEALQAQAIAARSYALSEDLRYQPYADTCDTTTCQVYGGRYRNLGIGIIESFFASTDAAIAATAGQVRVFSDGSIARTEFSSSSGGWTVDASALGGFPAVEDLGDATASNPNHNWQVTVDLTSWVASKGLGRLLAVEEVDRTGNGPEGGHVNRVEFIFEDGSISLTGDEVRNSSKFPATLKSRWFTFSDGDLDTLASNQAYVDEIYQLFLQRDPTVDERSVAANELLQGGSRFTLTSALSLSSEWAGVEIDDLYPIVFSRPADAGGRAFWLDQMIGGRQLQSVAAEFYGSPEFFEKVGSNNRAFVSALYDEIQERDPDGGGLTFWTDTLDNGGMSRTEVAAGFYASIESREGRVSGLYQQVLGRGPDAGGLAFWAEQLLTRDDVALAAELSASSEYFGLSQR